MLTELELTVNGETISMHVAKGRRLIDLLRDDLGLYGVKECCGEGECGSCTVLLNGIAVLACIIPMERAIGGTIITIEGIGSANKLHPIQEAMIQEGAVQCGICSPGMIMAGIDLLNRIPNPTEDEVLAGIAGNICRCTGYQKVVTAIIRAAQAGASGEEPLQRDRQDL